MLGDRAARDRRCLWVHSQVRIIDKKETDLPQHFLLALCYAAVSPESLKHRALPMRVILGTFETYPAKYALDEAWVFRNGAWRRFDDAEVVHTAGALTEAEFEELGQLPDLPTATFAVGAPHDVVAEETERCDPKIEHQNADVPGLAQQNKAEATASRAMTFEERMKKILANPIFVPAPTSGQGHVIVGAKPPK
jgi:hypothetical protein